MKQIIEPVQSNLPIDISVKKKEMLQMGFKYGLADNRTIKCSQELDDLLNKYAIGYSYQ